ncbi:MAG: PDZ domain-containing protein [Oscillospiraceae bacterium]|nr:PDZ domain-containing protein [Oscillospiraceae bacterium]
MKKQVRFSAFISGILLAFLAGFVLHMGFAGILRPHSVIAEAEEQIKTKFIGEYDAQTVQDMTIESMVNALGDQWSHYLTPEEFTAYKAAVQNAYVGIGVTVEQKEDRGKIQIREVQEGGAAQKAGVQPGEWIVAVDGVSLEGKTMREARRLIAGAEGTDVTLTIQAADGTERDVVLTRSAMAVVPVKYEMLEQQVGYIKIVNFDSTSSQYAKKAVQALMDQGAESLIFDVRNNPGGLLSELLDLLDFLLPECDTFFSVSYTGQEVMYHSDENSVDLPVAVLVNQETYSAAEFFAAVFQETGRGQVVGVQTSGKGYSQVPIPLSNGGAIVLSTAKYFTPDKVSLIGKGVVPDMVQNLTEEQETALQKGSLPKAEDPQVQAAWRILTKTP